MQKVQSTRRPLPGQLMPTTSETPSPPPLARPRLPSLRVAMALAVGMLALGAAVGAATGPAPSASFAGERTPLLLPSLIALATAGGPHASAATVVQPPPVTAQANPAVTS